MSKIIEFVSPAGKLLRQLADPSLGESPWFVARDVCAALGLKGNAVLTQVPERHKGTCLTGTPGGPQRVNVVSESGLYRLAMRSRKQEALEFADWVTDVVLPEIRRTGGYRAQEVDDTRARLGSLERAVAGLVEAVGRLAERIPSSGAERMPVISAGELAKMLRRLAFVSQKSAHHGLFKSPGAARYNYESRVRRAAGWPRSKGAKLGLMPESSWAYALVELSEIEADLERQTGSKQLVLFRKA